METRFPTILVKEIKTLREWDGTLHTRPYFWTAATMAEVELIVEESERPGFGQEYESIQYEVYQMTTVLAKTIVPEPKTMAESALLLERYAHSGCTSIGDGLKVKIGLRGKGYDPQSVFWTERGNSFAIVQPDPTNAAHVRLTTKQGVMLVSINGIGEIRWDVTRTSSMYGEDLEAFKHFNLEW